MNKKYWLLLFAVLLLGDLAGLQFQYKEIQYILKPLLVPAVIGYFYSRLMKMNRVISTWVLFALLFSWAGDVLLMFEEKNSIFFLLGLSAFLVAHIFYIVFFHRVRLRENVKSKVWLILPVAIYYAGLMILLSPGLGDMAIPVRIYGVVISFMFLLALHLLFITNRTAGTWMMAGALLFVLSDSVLALNKFYTSFEGAGVFIMLTYGLAQLFITEGAARYIRLANTR